METFYVFVVIMGLLWIIYVPTGLIEFFKDLKAANKNLGLPKMKNPPAPLSKFMSRRLSPERRKKLEEALSSMGKDKFFQSEKLGAYQCAIGFLQEKGIIADKRKYQIDSLFGTVDLAGLLQEYAVRQLLHYKMNNNLKQERLLWERPQIRTSEEYEKQIALLKELEEAGKPSNFCERCQDSGYDPFAVNDGIHEPCPDCKSL